MALFRTFFSSRFRSEDLISAGNTYQFYESLSEIPSKADGDVTTAIVVEGGAMRAIFACGVMDELLHSGMHNFDFALGVSAGASTLAGFVCGQPERNYRAITDYARGRNFFSPYRFAKGGNLTDVSWLWHHTQQQYPLYSERFEAATPLYAVITHAHTGQAYYPQITEENLHEVMVATCAMPFLYRNVALVDGEPFVDGGVADPIPVQHAYDMGARDITVVLSRPWGYRKKHRNTPKVMHRVLGEQAALMASMVGRAEQYNSSLDFIANPPGDCRINLIAPPDTFPVMRLTRSRQKLDQGYFMGRSAGKYYINSRAFESVTLS